MEKVYRLTFYDVGTNQSESNSEETCETHTRKGKIFRGVCAPVHRTQ